MYKYGKDRVQIRKYIVLKNCHLWNACQAELWGLPVKRLDSLAFSRQVRILSGGTYNEHS